LGQLVAWPYLRGLTAGAVTRQTIFLRTPMLSQWVPVPAPVGSSGVKKEYPVLPKNISVAEAIKRQIEFAYKRGIPYISS
jgi:hypothetical protein